MADRLRRSFDLSFADPLVEAAEPTDDFLAIRAGAEGVAVRLAEVAGIYVDRSIVALPGPLPELLGIVAIRGSVRPVYDFGALLGQGPGGAGRWLLLTGTTDVIALACSAFDGHVRSPRREVAREKGSHTVRAHVRVGDGAWPIINLASLVEAVRQRVRDIAPLKEP